MLCQGAPKEAKVMADYREISQQYAKEGVRTCILLNAGAAATLLSQATDLIQLTLADEVRAAMLWWMTGIVAGTLIWLLAFAATRYVDKHEREGRDDHLRTSNRFMNAGLACFAISVVCFVGGCISLAQGIGD
jgi:tetrahydromethanopterin S-methyltransferase subunit D